MYMNFQQEYVDKFMRNHAYMKMSQTLTHRVTVQNNICLLPLMAEVNHCYANTRETPRTPMFALWDTYVLLI